MQIITKDEFKASKNLFIKKLDSSVFIYPTDTIYGIGCNAEDDSSVLKIRELKGRFEMPFSVIAPSKKWIEDNCLVDEKARAWIDKLPGPYTLIFKLKNHNSVASNVNPHSDTLGVRIPDNWFSNIVSELGFPIITTSANLVGYDFMTSIDDLHPDIKKGVDFFIDEGEIHGVPSTLVFLDKDSVEIKTR